MSEKVLDRNAYTIGWICALSVEFAAAQAFLDERHQVPSDVSDSNSYVTGRIGKHNVVIAVMPQNEYGTATAATTAKDMVRSFPQVRLGLMVGIGGGAPSQEHDIRLGDVVVSSRGKGTGGVIQFDYGKTIQDQEFKETDHLNQPPTALMTAAAALDAQYDLEGPQLNDKVNTALVKQRKAFRKKYLRPPDDTDRLYRSKFTHPEGLSGDCVNTCGVGSDDLVHRPSRSDDDDNPTVHYGLIASSNQVMKDAIKRDKLVQRGVLCFEMEAAGLMNQFPCLVVRGICDYADTHKNSAWQPYAAMVAAAYAKDLLGLVNVTAVEGEKKLSELIVSVASMQREHNETLKHTRNAVDEIESQQRMANMKQWLGPANPSDNANRAKDLRYEGTGTWFLNSPAFEHWLKDRHRHLCLYGAGGCGKTVLASTILDFLRGNRNGTILYFFFDFSDAQKRTFGGLVRSLLFQLYTAEGVSTQQVDELLKSHDDGKRSPSTAELLKCLQDVLATSKEAAILMDALDECEEKNNERNELIKWIVTVGSTPSLKHVKIIITARPEAAFKNWLDPELADSNCVELAKDSIKADIESYVKGCLKHRPGFHTQAPDHPIVKQIPARLIRKADGMFRYAACQIDDIVNCFSPEEIEDVLDALPETIQETYKRSIERIPLKHKLKAIRILQFLVNLDKPLELAVAVDIVTVRSDFRAFAAADRVHPQDIVRLCPNLLSIVEVQNFAWHERSESLELHLAHVSVKEYLVQFDDPEFTFGGVDASVSIARTCLSYLLAYPPGKGPRDNAMYDGNPWMEDNGLMYGRKSCLKEETFPFIKLAVHMLDRHAAAAEGSPHAVSEMADQLQNDLKECPFAPTQWHKALHYSVNAHASCLHFACYLGLLETSKNLAKRGVDVRYQTENSLSPIGIAVRMNRVGIVQFLLDFGVSPNTAHSQSLYGSILRCSCKFSRHEITRLLARKGADLNRLEGDENRRESPLQIAIQQADLKLVRLLLDEGADVNAHCGYLGTALVAAVRFGACGEEGVMVMLWQQLQIDDRGASASRYVDIVMALLDRGADVNVNCEFNGTALQVAARLGNVDMVEALLDRGADVNAKGGIGGHALQAAAEAGHGGIVALLLDRGADLNASSATEYGNAMQAAFRLYKRDAISVLLGRGADINADDNAYRHAFESAAGKGHEDVIRLLLERGAGSDAEDKACGSALEAALKKDQEGIVGLLLDRRADSNTRGNTYGHALKTAVKNSHEDVVRLLLERGGNAIPEDDKWNPSRQALQSAVREGYGDIVKIFLNKGAADAGKHSLETILYVAAARGNQDLTELLLESGANVTTQGGSLENAVRAAVTGGHQSLVEILLQRGANANASQGQLGSLLYMACRRESPEVMRCLLKYGADANATIPGFGSILYRYIWKRVSWGDKPKTILKILLEAGAKVQWNADPSNHVLRLAVERGALEPVRLLLTYGSDPNMLWSTDQPQYNHGLLIESLFKSQPDIAQALIDFGADPNGKTSRRLPNQTALHLAMDGDFEEVVRLLLQKGADPNGLSGFPPFTPLQLSVRKGSVKYTRLFLEHGADVQTLGGYRNNLTAVNLAERAGNEEILQLLAQAITEKKKHGKRKHAETLDNTTENLVTEKLQRRGV